MHIYTHAQVSLSWYRSRNLSILKIKITGYEVVYFLHIYDLLDTGVEVISFTPLGAQVINDEQTCNDLQDTVYMQKNVLVFVYVLFDNTKRASVLAYYLHNVLNMKTSQS